MEMMPQPAPGAGGPPPQVSAAEIGDRSKSRQFRQALGFAASDLEDLLRNLPDPLKEVLRNSQANIVDPAQDPRVILANLHTAAQFSGEKTDILVDRYLDFPSGLSFATRLPANTVVIFLRDAIGPLHTFLSVGTWQRFTCRSPNLLLSRPPRTSKALSTATLRRMARGSTYRQKHGCVHRWRVQG
jgi:hypothetical protein